MRIRTENRATEASTSYKRQQKNRQDIKGVR
jgi:hypothetical protein